MTIAAVALLFAADFLDYQHFFSWGSYNLPRMIYSFFGICNNLYIGRPKQSILL
jgi:hypothetical protein